MLVANIVKHAPSDTKEELVLCVSKMSRLFYSHADSMISLGFPFTYQKNADDVAFTTHDGYPLTHETTSLILSLLPSISTPSSPHCFIDALIDTCAENHDIMGILRNLIISDDGYIRYDHDDAHQAEGTHPLDHIDFYYYNNSKSKFGLHKKITESEFIDMLDITTQCYFFKK